MIRVAMSSRVGVVRGRRGIARSRRFLIILAFLEILRDDFIANIDVAVHREEFIVVKQITVV